MASQRPELTWDYDEQSDILYISFGEPVAAYSEHADESILLRYSMQDETLVGMTIIGYHEMGGIDALRPAFCSRHRTGVTPCPA